MATRKQIIIPFILLFSAISITAILIALESPPEDKKLEEFIPIVKVDVIKTTNLPMMVNSQGTVMPKESTVLVAQVGGKITKLSNAFIRGGFVKAGEVLAWIDDSDYQTQLIEAQANLASARASLQEEKAKGHVAEREWQQITNASPSELGLRKPQLAQEVAKVRAATAGVSRAKRNLERTQIVAPYDAIVEDKKVGLGSFVSGGSIIGDIARVDVGEIRLPIADKDLRFLENQGINAKVIFSAIYNGKPTQWEGLIVRDEGIIDSKSRMNYLVAQVKKPYELDNPLKFGSYVSAEIIGETIENAVIIPRYVIEERGIAFMTDENTLHFESINIIRKQGEEVVISGQLNGHDKLIISALDVAIEGMKVNLLDASAFEKNNSTTTDSAMNQSGEL